MKRMIYSILVAMLIGLAACGGRNGATGDTAGGEAVAMRHARNLEMRRGDGYTEVRVRNPWDTTRTLHTYVLVHRDSAVPAQLPQGTVVRVPLRNALVYSTVHCTLIEELGAAQAIGGVCDAPYIKSAGLRSRLAAGTLADCGPSHAPDIERILRLRPEAVLLSPYENNSEYAKVAELGIPVIECADYTEPTPLGRVEWERFYGLLFGRGAEADSLFADTERRYAAISGRTAHAQTRPSVLMDQKYGQVWHVPTRNSIYAIMIRDAGGTNPFDAIEGSVNAPLAPERVLAMAHDADVWMVRYNQEETKSLAELGRDAAVNPQFEAWRRGNVYGCNTRVSGFYEETPFHPDRVLHDLQAVLHPEIFGDSARLNYFAPLR